MAKIVLGIGSSHGPMLVTETDIWDARVPFDKVVRHAWRNGSYSFDELVTARKDENLGRMVSKQVWDEQQVRCQSSIEKLADAFADAKIDVAVVIGNDQMEIFDERLIPAFAVHYGETITNYEFSDERMAAVPVGVAPAIPGYIPKGGAEYPGNHELARHIIRQVMDDNFDVAAMNGMPKPETPHAWGFIFRRIMRDNPVPTVMVTVNAFYPPNQPSVRRCYDLGKSIVKAIESWRSDARVALIASGGLTHFVVDEGIDRTFLDALRNKDIDAVEALGEGVFQDGTSELKNWVPVAGAMAEVGLEPDVLDYVPCYRSEAGTGNAMGFVCWR